MKKTDDVLNRFLFDQADIRGEITKLDASWQAILSNHNYPALIRDYLGQFVAASVLLSATLKFQGSLTIQASGEGELSLLVVECRNDFAIRGVAKYRDSLPQNANLQSLLGNGNLVITIEQSRNKERYQGVVALKGDSVAELLENYLRYSEQLETRIFLAASETTAGGLLVQKLPGKDDQENDTWERASHLASTITEAELLSLPAKEILHRLYHEDDIRLFPPEAVKFECSCSREKVTSMLHSLQQQEAEMILQEQQVISVDCEYCGKVYQFDEIDIAEIFTGFTAAGNSKTRH